MDTYTYMYMWNIYNIIVTYMRDISYYYYVYMYVIMKLHQIIEHRKVWLPTRLSSLIYCLSGEKCSFWSFILSFQTTFPHLFMLSKQLFKLNKDIVLRYKNLVISPYEPELLDLLWLQSININFCFSNALELSTENPKDI